MDEMKHSQEKIRQLWWVYFIPLILGLILRRSEGFVLVTILLIWSSFLVSVFTWIYSIWVFKKYWPEMVTKISPNLKVDDQTTEGPTRRVLVLHGPWVCRRLSSGLAMELFDLFDRPRFNFPDPRHRAIHSYSRIPLCKVLVLSHSG
ncbi:MAG: hypothetical protein UW88_C0021G0021 [Candidatus Collierbacteria bacterium GW2011_GWD2_45_10]|nr:MAG: hypothetical protein UW88_C0021G0021 [Candidatus Collierbacteria bacterium GW2011_GWD2_45_10]